MQKILVELNEKINWYKGFLGECQRDNLKEDCDYFKPFIDGLLYAKDLIVTYQATCNRPNDTRAKQKWTILKKLLAYARR